jgi:hypothetical protein
MNTQTAIETSSAKFQIKEVKIGDYVLQLGTNKDNKPTLYYGKTKTVGKNKGEIQWYGRYYYSTIEERNRQAEGKYNDFKSRIEDKQKKSESEKNAKAQFNTSDLIGKVFYSSWGYDQTNVDFYQVTGATKSCAKIRRISGEMVDNTAGMMCCNLKPIKDSFIGTEETKQIKVRGAGENIDVTICNGRYPLREYTRGENGVYCSWYA